MSFLDFIDNENNIAFEIGKGLSSESFVYAIEEYFEIIEFNQNNVNFAKMSRYPYIKKRLNSIDKDLYSNFEPYIDNINKVFFRFSRQLGLKSTTDYDETLKSLIMTTDNIKKKYSINFVLFRDFPHTPFEIVFYYYALIHKIETQFLFPLPRINRTEERFILTPDFSLLPKKFWDNYKMIKETSSELHHEFPNDLLAYYEEYDKNIKENKYYFGIRQKRFKLLSRYFKRIKTNLKVNGMKKTLIKVLQILKYIFPINSFSQRNILRFYERNAIKDLPANEEYLYFALHYQPEATTIPWGNKYSNQLVAIQEISKNLPVGYFLYVKEHPTYWNLDNSPNFNEYRSKDFYREIMKLDNVRLISHYFASHILIPKTKCVVTVTGTIAFESFYLNKPCIVLGSIYYKDFPTSFSPSNYGNDLSLALSEALNFETNKGDNEFEYYLMTFRTISINTLNPLNPVLYNHSWESPKLRNDELDRYIEYNSLLSKFIIDSLNYIDQS